MVVGEFTVSSISADQDRKDEELEAAIKKAADHTKLKADINRLKELAKSGSVNEAVEQLLTLEKQHRLGEDVGGTKLCCAAVLEVLFEAGQWKQLCENIVLLAKRRSQLKQAVQAFVKQGMSYISQTPDLETKVELLKTLQSVTEGKIYVEIERARLTKMLARIKEDEGNIDEAADILQEVAVETFGAMAKTEKINYILDQVRLCLDRKDFVRAQILAKKISPRAFAEAPKKEEKPGEKGIEGTTIEHPDEGTPTLQELKLIYYGLLIRYHAEHNSYLEVCRCFRAIYETPTVGEDSSLWIPILKKICWYVVLAPSSSDQITLLNLTANDKRLDQLPAYKDLLSAFTTKEIAWWGRLLETYTPEIEAEADIFGGEKGLKRRADFHLRVTEHNILVAAKYYRRIKLARLAQLLDLDVAATEKHLSDMVVAKALYARLDRPEGIIRFSRQKDPNQILDGWATNISKLLETVERVCQTIQKEFMVYKVPLEKGRIGEVGAA